MTKKKNRGMTLSEIVPLINEQGMTLTAIAKRYKRKILTVHRWVRKLRANGYEIKTKTGRRKIPLV